MPDLNVTAVGTDRIQPRTRRVPVPHPRPARARCTKDDHNMVTSDLGACEWFVWNLRRSGLIDRGPLDQIVGEYLRKNPRAEAPALAEYLVEQGTITEFQAERILNGKSQGLVLGPY